MDSKRYKLQVGEVGMEVVGCGGLSMCRRPCHTASQYWAICCCECYRQDDMLQSSPKNVAAHPAVLFRTCPV